MSGPEDNLAGVERLYARLAPVYDLLWGVGLEHGRRRAMTRLRPQPGERILEIGVGTGLSACAYPPGCQVTAIDLSAPMLARAGARLRRRGIAHVTLLRMDAADLAFPDGAFDAVYAPYVINVVSNPLAVVREMRRVCRPGGRFVLLNHFAPGAASPWSALSRAAVGLAVRAGGIDARLELQPFLRSSGLVADSIDRVNLGIASVVVCRSAPFFREPLHDVSRSPHPAAVGRSSLLPSQQD